LSKGAMKELAKAGYEKFGHLTKDIPNSEKRQIIKYFADRVTILEGSL